MSVTDDLHVAPGLVLPAAELEWTFSTSGGPGGQHANRSQTRAELRFDLGASGAVPDELKSRMMERLGDRLVMVTVDESRSQWRNRQLARRRLADLLREAMRPERRRKPTKPSRAAKRRRLEEKRRRGRIKDLRKPPEIPE